MSFYVGIAKDGPLSVLFAKEGDGKIWVECVTLFTHELDPEVNNLPAALWDRILKMVDKAEWKIVACNDCDEVQALPNRKS